MANFPIFQGRQIDASPMIINWAGAGDKIMRGLVTGMELGLKIRDSNQDALLNAARIQQINESVAASQISTALAQKASASTLALQELERQKAAAEVAQITDQQNLAAQKANWKAQQAQAQNVIESNAIVGMMTDKLRDPDVIRARRIVQSLPSLSADPVALIQKTEELQQLWDDEGSGVSAYDELQKEFQARNPTARLSPELTVPDMNEVYAMLDNPKSGYGIKTGLNVKKTVTVDDPTGAGPKTTTVEEPEILSVSEYIRRLQSDSAVVKRAIEDSRPTNRKANIEWLKKNVAASTLRTAGVRDVFPGTEQEWAALQTPAALAVPESPEVLSGKKTFTTVGGEKVLIDRPTGIFDGATAKIKASKIMDLGLRSKTPGGPYSHIRNLDTNERGQLIDYWERTRKALADTQQSEKPEDRAVSQLVIEQVDAELGKLYKQYGMTPRGVVAEKAKPVDTGAKVVAEGVTKNVVTPVETLPVLTPEEARKQPSGTRYKTTDGRTGRVP